MIIKKIFYKKNNDDDDWNLGIIFECKGDMDNTIISDDGNIIGKASFLEVREVVNEFVIINIGN